MSGVQILTSFFADQVLQAQQQVNRTRTELENADDDHAKVILQQELIKAQAYLDVATKTKELFDANRLTERQLKDSLQSLRGGNNG
jgi:hypothetical protein